MCDDASFRALNLALDAYEDMLDRILPGVRVSAHRPDGLSQGAWDRHCDARDDARQALKLLDQAVDRLNDGWLAKYGRKYEDLTDALRQLIDEDDF